MVVGSSQQRTLTGTMVLTVAPLAVLQTLMVQIRRSSSWTNRKKDGLGDKPAKQEESAMVFNQIVSLVWRAGRATRSSVAGQECGGDYWEGEATHPRPDRGAAMVDPLLRAPGRGRLKASILRLRDAGLVRWPPLGLIFVRCPLKCTGSHRRRTAGHRRLPKSLFPNATSQRRPNAGNRERAQRPR